MNTGRIKTPIILMLAVIIGLLAFPQAGLAEEVQPSEITIKDWQIQWFNDKTQQTQLPSSTDPWLNAGTNPPITDLPDGYNGAWVHIVIPPTAGWQTPGLLISQMYGLDIAVYEDNRLLYRSTRDSAFIRNMLLLTLTPNSEPTDLFIRITSVDRAGVSSIARVGEYSELSKSYFIGEMPNLMLGSSIAFMALIMLLISGYLNTQQRRAWVALSLIALGASILIITFSTLPFVYFPHLSRPLSFLFDISMLVVFPALHWYAASVFEGKLAFYKKFGQWFVGYSAFCFPILLLNEFIGNSFYFYYRLFSFYLLAPLLLIHLALVLSHSVIQAVRGNKNSLILALGFLAFAITFAADLLSLFISDSLKLPYLWKIGVVLLIVSLIIVLARKISVDYRKLLSYSKELELFNRQLQRTEKLKFISDLAASIAHEVRNPLQVTRGFLQLIAGKSDEASKSHFSMAISELDRASMIITDFLTFAKPELDTEVTTLDIKQELTMIETIIGPLAAMNGAALQVNILEKYHVLGSPSKFKQAIMNMVKNSIEAIQAKENGIVGISAHAEEGMVVIRISDNGDGMEEEQIAKLGEPYYSTKTKGTGLGLMVTFRIIEVMKGTLEFRSEKGKGTEALIRFPLASEN